ncbi:MAG: hypothetical protein FWE45_01865 [Firmicutes bacterium]|nr:hypothetical protein [Bacillota bacterium]
MSDLNVILENGFGEVIYARGNKQYSVVVESELFSIFDTETGKALSLNNPYKMKNPSGLQGTQYVDFAIDGIRLENFKGDDKCAGEKFQSMLRASSTDEKQI